MWPQFELAIEGSSHNLNEQAIALQTDDDETKQHSKCQEDCLIAVDPERVIFEDAKVPRGHLDTRQQTG